MEIIEETVEDLISIKESYWIKEYCNAEEYTVYNEKGVITQSRATIIDKFNELGSRIDTNMKNLDLAELDANAAELFGLIEQLKE